MRRHREEQAKLAKEEAEAAVRGRPILSAHLNVETAGHEPKRPEIWTSACLETVFAIF
jgi:hypothetical protein